MDDDYTAQDYENVLILRNQLVSLDISKLLEMYQDMDSFLSFIDSVVVLTNVDGGFLLLSDAFVDKIERIIQQHRFNIHDSKIVEVINDIIGYLNRIKSYDYDFKKLLITQYVGYHLDCRETKVDGSETFFSMLAYDAVLYAALKEGQMDIVTHDDFFLASLNFLIKTYPEFFEDYDIQKRVMDKIDEISLKKGFSTIGLRSYSKKTKANFQKICKKEE